MPQGVSALQAELKAVGIDCAALLTCKNLRKVGSALHAEFEAVTVGRTALWAVHVLPFQKHNVARDVGSQAWCISSNYTVGYRDSFVAEFTSKHIVRCVESGEVDGLS